MERFGNFFREGGGEGSAMEYASETLMYLAAE